MFGIKHKHIPVQDNRYQPPVMVCSDTKCNAMLGPATLPTPEEIKQAALEEQEQAQEEAEVEQKPKPLYVKKPLKQAKQQQAELSRDEILEMAIKKWGPALQINQAIQECAELIHELTDALRGQANLMEISEEMADVEIMLAQLKIIYNNKEQVKSWKVAKLQRLAEILMEPAKNTQEDQDPEDE